MTQKQHIVEDVHFLPNFFAKDESDRLLADIMNTTDWRHDAIIVYGKEHLQPRLTATQGEPGAVIRYNGRSFEPTPWSPAILAIKERVEAETGAMFNAVLMNLYRDGRDGVAYHSDEGGALGGSQVIASVSFGASRRFLMKPRDKESPETIRELILGHGDLLVMAGETQKRWLHSVPKTAKAVEPRINLTFRTLDS